MIQHSSVGIGINGKEGNAAANAADISIERFFHLTQLILVYGALNFERTSTGLLFFIYKNLVFTVPSLLFIFANNFRPVFLYDSMSSMFYTLLFTSFLILPISAFDFRYSSPFRKQYPSLYRASSSR